MSARKIVDCRAGLFAAGQQGDDLLPFGLFTERQVGLPGSRLQKRQPAPDHGAVERQAAEAVGGLAHHHGIDIQGADVGRPHHFLQQLGKQRRCRGADPLFIAKTFAQFTHLEGQAEAVVRLAAPHIAFLLQGFQQAPHGGAMQAGEFGQAARAGAPVEAIEGIEQGQAAA